MSGFAKRDLVVDGIRVQVLEAGRGDPIVYFHGAGATRGFDELLPLAQKRRLIVPIHPGFGASDDDPGIDSVLDYVVHYGALFDQLELDRPFDLIGHSLGGWIAALFAVFSGERLRRLVLVCPAGLRVSEFPAADLFTVPPEELPSRLAAAPAVLSAMLQGEVSNETRLAQYREMTSLARLIWDRNYQPKLDRWLQRVRVPSLILWGEQDRILPVQQAQEWARRLPAGTETATFADVGHLVLLEAPKAAQRIRAFVEDH
jgi:pimeloyl-ACP methyl ester carboxylesterase